MASFSNQLEAVDRLITARADVNCKDKVDLVAVASF
jgi:hypothetical protein